MRALELRQQGLMNDSSLMELLQLEDPANMRADEAAEWLAWLSTLNPLLLLPEELAMYNSMMSAVDEATENPWF
jgi:hypothetical protein